MAKTSTIEWLRGADGKPGASYNPWLGCHWVSPACDHCYALDWAHRYGRDFATVTRTHSTTFNGPKTWREPRRVFVCSLSDFFHPDVYRHDRHAAIHVMRDAPQHTYVLLTKRPENIKPMLLGTAWGERLPDNVWLGVTAENQEQADKRIPLLLAVPAKVHFVSCEPLLGPLDLTPYLYRTMESGKVQSIEHDANHITANIVGKFRPALDWVIVGGESGPHARPMHPSWASSLYAQCRAAGPTLNFHFKQWGEWFPVDQPFKQDNPLPLGKGQQWLNLAGGQGFHGEEVWRMEKRGKTAAGRVLFGHTFSEIPQ